MKKLLLIMILVVMICSICACATSVVGTYEENAIVDCEENAIDTAKHDTWVIDDIARKLRFKFYHDPIWGTCSAEENYDGSWEVTLKGKMSGYTDDYKEDFATKPFKVTLKVNKEGRTSSIYVTTP